MNIKRFQSIIFLLLLLGSIYSKAQDNLIFEVNLIQDGDTFNVSDNRIKLAPKNITFEIIMPAYMLEFRGRKFSSINYIATTSKTFFKSMVNSKCFRCENEIFPYAFNKHNSYNSIVVGEKGYSFWTVSEDLDNHNVSSQRLVGKEIIANIIIKTLYLQNEEKDVLLDYFKGIIYFVFEAVNRDSSIVGKRTFVKMKVR